MLNHIWIRKLCYFSIRTSHGAQKDDWKSNNMLIIIIIFIIMNLKHFPLVKCPLRGMLNVLSITNWNSIRFRPLKVLAYIKTDDLLVLVPLGWQTLRPKRRFFLSALTDLNLLRIWAEEEVDSCCEESRWCSVVCSVFVIMTDLIGWVDSVSFRERPLLLFSGDVLLLA